MTIPPDRSEPLAGQVYRAFWRWHFYAGLLVLPFLMLLALTGGLYLFKDEIDGVLYRPLQTVAARPVATTPQAWVNAAETGVGGKAVQLALPSSPGQTARVIVEAPDGARRAAFVDLHDARLVGSMPAGGVMTTVKRIHSLEIAGPLANYLVEIVAGWAIVMVATGLVLWWPRGQDGGVVSVRGAPNKRVFWRDLHAVTGLFAGSIIVFLAVTGMPWSAFWGQQVRMLTTEAGWGRPAAPASLTAGGHSPGHRPAPASANTTSDALPWALQHAGMPPAHRRGPSALDAVVAAIDRNGLPKPYVVTLPQADGKAWAASHQPDRVENTRTLYLDGDGRVIADIGYGQFGPAAQAIEWGISVHQGQQFGRINQLLMLAGCVGIWLLGLTAPIMWWKRRPKGRLAAPPPPTDRRALLPLAAVVIPLAVLFPLVGASLILVLGLDLTARNLRPPAARTAGA